jgi:hypothetical protein
MNSQVTGAGDRVLLVLITWALTQAASKGWLSTSDIAVLAPALVLLPAIIIGWYKNTKAAIVARASNLPDVKGVITTSTAAGVALASSVPSMNVVPEGTNDAAVVAKQGG